MANIIGSNDILSLKYLYRIDFQNADTDPSLARISEVDMRLRYVITFLHRK